MSSVIRTTDVTATVPPVALDTASRWIDNIRYARDLTLYKAEQAEHRYARRLALPIIATTLGLFNIATITVLVSYL